MHTKTTKAYVGRSRVAAPVVSTPADTAAARGKAAARAQFSHQQFAAGPRIKARAMFNQSRYGAVTERIANS